MADHGCAWHTLSPHEGVITSSSAPSRPSLPPPRGAPSRTHTHTPPVPTTTKHTHTRTCATHRGSAGVDQELVVLDAAHQLCLPSVAAAALLASPAAGTLLPTLCTKALGRTSNPEVRLAALHALASLAGLERAGEARDRTAALLPGGVEEALRQGVYGAVAGG